MRSITFEKLLNGVASTAGIDPANLLAHEKINLTEYINDAIRFCWDYYPWAEFTVVEKRYFREAWSSSNVYSEGDEVYHEGKYYKVWANLAGNPTGAPNTDPSTWHEIGDLTQNPAWSEKGLYELGAIVKYENENYLCIQVPAGGTSSGMQQTNFEYDAITPENTLYFKKLDERFERYIDYEQTGRNPIETVISVHRTDPRYTKSMPLNFREDVEGIYIQAEDEAVNEVWVRFRIDSPVYETTSLTAEVPKFLVPALKAHAYKSWLTGDGQHEKAELQEIKVLDLLVRETDKLDQQQDRAKPYVIRKNPYRRFNSTQAYTTGVTEDQINQIHDGFVDTSLTFKLNSTGRNSVVSSTTSCTTAISFNGFGGNKAKIAGRFVQGGDPVIGKYIIFLQGYNHPIGTGRFPPNTYFQIEHIDYNSTTGEVEGIEYNANFTDSNGTSQVVYQGIDATNYLNQKGTFWDVLSFDIANFNPRIDLDAGGKNAIVESGVSQINLVLFTGSRFRGQNIGEVEGFTVTGAQVDFVQFSMSVTAKAGATRSGAVQSAIALSTTVDGENVFKTSSVNLSTSLSVTATASVTQQQVFGAFFDSGRVNALLNIAPDSQTRSGDSFLGSQYLFDKYVANLGGALHTSSGGSYTGSGGHLQLGDPFFDQDNFVIMGWLDLENNYNGGFPSADLFTWNGYGKTPALANTFREGLSIIKSDDFEFKIHDEGTHFTPRIHHSTDTIDITNPDAGYYGLPTSTAQPSFEGLLTGAQQQFWAIRVRTHSGGNKEIEWFYGTHIVASYTTSVAGTTFYVGGGKRTFSSYTTVGTSNSLNIGQDAHYPTSSVQCIMWKDPTWTDANQFRFPNEANKIKKYGAGADLRTFNGYTPFDGYWRMGDHGFYDSAGVRTTAIGGTSTNSAIGDFYAPYNRDAFPNEA